MLLEAPLAVAHHAVAYSRPGPAFCKMVLAVIAVDASVVGDHNRITAAATPHLHDTAREVLVIAATGTHDSFETSFLTAGFFWSWVQGFKERFPRHSFSTRRSVCVHLLGIVQVQRADDNVLLINALALANKKPIRVEPVHQ